MSRDQTRSAQRRRLQNTLAMTGAGIIAFGAWSLAKTTLTLVLVGSGLQLPDLGMSETMETAIAYFTVILAASIDLGIRAYIGLCARAESKGRKKRGFYLVVAGLITVASALGIVTAAFDLGDYLSVADAMASMLVDVTSIAMLVLMIRSAVLLRRLDGNSE